MEQGVLRTADDGRRLMFWCPGCDGAHQVTIGWGQSPSWGFNGDYEKPTFTPSVFVNPGRQNPDAHVCHSFVREGEIQFLTDCTHELAGQTVPLQPF